MSNWVSIAFLFAAAAIFLWLCLATICKVYNPGLNANGVILYGSKLIFRSALLFAALVGLSHGLDVELGLSKSNLVGVTIYNVLRGLAWITPLSFTAVGANLVAGALTTNTSRKLTCAQAIWLLAKGLFKLRV